MRFNEYNISLVILIEFAYTDTGNRKNHLVRYGEDAS